MSSGRFSLNNNVGEEKTRAGSTSPMNQTGRQVLTPNTMTVTFDGTSPGNRSPNSKIDKVKSPPTQIIPSKKSDSLENGKKQSVKGTVADSSNGIRLVGYKMTSEAGVVNGGVANDKQKQWTPLSE